MSETPINPAEDPTNPASSSAPEGGSDSPSFDPAQDDDEQDVDPVQVPGTPATGPEAPIPPTEG